jgi:hypothetical protein
MPVPTNHQVETMKPNRNFLEALLEGTEAALDLATDNEAIKAVPIVGSCLKIAQGINDIRSRVLVAKLTRFIDEPALRASAESRAFRATLVNDDGQAEKVGETLFLVLEKVTDLEKPSMLAKLFAAYLDEVIDSFDLLRLMHAVDMAYIDDLHELADPNPSDDRDTWRQNLVSLGLTLTKTGTSWDDDGVMTYPETPLGIKFQQAIQHAMTLRPS